MDLKDSVAEMKDRAQHFHIVLNTLEVYWFEITEIANIRIG